jgi:hypothetical protein
MMTRAEKLFCVEVQMQKAVSLVDHGDNPGAIMAIVDAIRTMAAIQKEKSEFHPEAERVKEAEPTKLKVKK